MPQPAPDARVDAVHAASLTSRPPSPVSARRATPRAVRRKDRMRTYLSFETAVADIEARLDEMRAVAEKGDLPALADELASSRPGRRRRWPISTPA